MDWLTFIAELTGSLAWPLVVISVVLLFQAKIKKLVDRIKKGKFGPAEFEFEEALKELQHETAELPPPPASPAGTRPIVVTADARSTVLNAWLEVETALLRLARTTKVVNPKFVRSPYQSMRALEKTAIVRSDYAEVFYELRRLRNQATHEPDFNPSQESLLTFVRLSKELATYLEGITPLHADSAA